MQSNQAMLLTNQRTLESCRVSGGPGKSGQSCICHCYVVYPDVCFDLNYPLELKYTFEVLQKIVMELDADTLTQKVLKNRLCFSVMVTANSVTWQFSLTESTS